MQVQVRDIMKSIEAAANKWFSTRHLEFLQRKKSVRNIKGLSKKINTTHATHK